MMMENINNKLFEDVIIFACCFPVTRLAETNKSHGLFVFIRYAILVVVYCRSKPSGSGRRNMVISAIVPSDCIFSIPQNMVISVLDGTLEHLSSWHKTKPCLSCIWIYFVGKLCKTT